MYSSKLGISFNIIASLPYTFTIYMLPLSKDHFESIPCNAIRAIKLLKFHEVVRLISNIEDIWKRQGKPTGVLVYKAFYFLVLLSHLMTCTWLFVNRVNETSETEWFELAGLQSASNSEIYIEASFFIVTTLLGMGMGNLYPVNQAEYILCLLTMFIGASIFAAFFSFFVVAIYNKNAVFIENTKKFESAMNLANKLNLEGGTKGKIRTYF